jgi:hypothetical protein
MQEGDIIRKIKSTGTEYKILEIEDNQIKIKMLKRPYRVCLIDRRLLRSWEKKC